MSVFQGMRTKVGVVSGAVLLASVGLGATSGTASAASSDCPEGWFCVWDGRNYTGRMQQVQYDNADLSQYAVFNGRVLSYYNNGNSCDVTIYSGKNYTGSNITAKRGAKDTATSSQSAGAILSNKWVNCR